MRVLLGNVLWNLVAQSDMMTKIILLGLLFLSIVCWTIVFYKLILLNVKKQQLKDAVIKLEKIENYDQIIIIAHALYKTYPGHLLNAQCNQAQKVLQRTLKKEFLDYELKALDEQRFTLLDDMISVEESYISLLSVTAAVAPLIGLFGTVWGLTHSFISISEKQVADIVTIAPGIAEALLTTVAGLMVAIPASVSYYYIKGEINKVEFDLQKLSDNIQNNVRITLLEGKSGYEIPITAQQTQTTVAS